MLGIEYIHITSGMQMGESIYVLSVIHEVGGKSCKQHAKQIKVVQKRNTAKTILYQIQALNLSMPFDICKPFSSIFIRSFIRCSLDFSSLSFSNSCRHPATTFFVFFYKQVDSFLLFSLSVPRLFFSNTILSSPFLRHCTYFLFFPHIPSSDFHDITEQK